MPSAGDYGYYRRWYEDVTADLTMAAGTGDTTLITARNANYTIFVQRIIAFITTDAAQSWSFEDSAGTPVQIAEVTTSPGDSTRWDFDFGPAGAPLTEGKNLLLNVSAAGLAGHVHVEAYQKLTAVVNANAGASLQ